MTEPRELSLEELHALAAMERMMDDGAQPFVKLGDQRLAVSAEALEHFGLRQGQTINHTIFLAILKWNIAACEAGLAIERAQAAVRNKEPQP